jgi:NDP-sugar pyrophosphorylase family protein
MAESKLSDVDVLILCGGRGTRLRNTVTDVPKVLAPIDGRPFLDLMVAYLAAQSVTRVILCVGVGREQVAAHVARRPPPFAIELSAEVAPLGTAGALTRALSRCRNEELLVLNGDSLCPVDLGALINFHRGRQADFTLVVSPPGGSGDCGSVSADGAGRIFGFREKPGDGPAGERSAGIYAFSRRFLQLALRSSRGSLEHELFAQAASSRAFVYRQSFDFVDIGTPERYRRAPERLRSLGLVPKTPAPSLPEVSVVQSVGALE